ncbi:hypothetical protein GNI_134060 [Gregarina niphandrodes]|uniref:Uncharacterized protein n=1 Tax=Gregarina niphandrodes TaxID=110365 RepID=A0A023B1D2_GRENI|nr:hypothetical protein GNI_134060 [Gregarina niphandrodes]EZG46383.1 hypothetical protein GNI_134060 [Gregarina niphandrodes]|eukprot:XP_011132311.1 hypothetical protein GNI_134060 [Gregarina niphandrodes]
MAEARVVRYVGADGSALSTVSVETAQKWLSCGGEEELSVVSVIADLACALRNGAAGWWVLGDLELRCFREPLDEIAEGPIAALRQSFWKSKPNQGVYRLRWIELLWDGAARRFRRELGDPLAVRDALYEACAEHMVSVCQATGSRRLYFFAEGEAVAAAVERDAVAETVRSISANVHAQVKKLDFIYILWNLFERGRTEDCRTYLECYFASQLPWPVRTPEWAQWLAGDSCLIDTPGEQAVLEDDILALKRHLLQHFG